MKNFFEYADTLNGALEYNPVSVLSWKTAYTSVKDAMQDSYTKELFLKSFGQIAEKCNTNKCILI